jgi:N-acyl-D-amino-acid deacylase
MPSCDLLIRNATVIDGNGSEPEALDVALEGDRISSLGRVAESSAREVFDAKGQVLAPGFIDVHTHDDTSVIRTPQMLAKLSQGVTTVVVGNCGISAAPVELSGDPPDPMNLLGDAEAFRYPTFAAYRRAIEAARPAVNVAALVGHTALRNNHLKRLDRAATAEQIEAMVGQLREALAGGALGLSSGLAYRSARAASSEEILRLAEPLADSGAVYATHLRSEADAVLDALNEAFDIARQSRVPLIVSHLKCAGIANWGRAAEVLAALDSVRASQPVGCDCYPYAASSSTLDLEQVDERIAIQVTWSKPHPEMAGQSLRDIAASWRLSQREAGRRLQPAGAIYHGMWEDDVRLILRHPATMIGSDGLPNDPRPHPRLWGTFPRVLGQYSRDEKLFPLPEAVRKMTSLPAGRFGLAGRGRIGKGDFADLVLFDPRTIGDTATFSHPISSAQGITAVWVNGVLSYRERQATGERGGRFLPRGSSPPAGNLSCAKK